jgi:hypothetical protein
MEEKRERKGGFWPLLCTFTHYKYIISIMTNTFNQLAVLHVCNDASSQRLAEIFYLARGKSEVLEGGILIGLLLTRLGRVIPKCAKAGALQ